MIFREADIESRTVRTDSQGKRWQYSNKKSHPTGQGWEKVKNPVYHWRRPHSLVRQEISQVEKKTRPPFAATPELQAVDSRVGTQLAVGIENMLQKFRDEVRRSASFQNNPFLVGDRVKIADQGGKIFYVTGYNEKTNEIVVVNADNKDDIHFIPFDQAKQDPLKQEVPWDIGDIVKIAAGAITGKEVSGQIVGFDDRQNKLRIQIDDKEFTVYPENIRDILVREPQELAKIGEELDKDSERFSTKDSRRVIEALLRAVRDKREEVSVNELRHDIVSVTGEPVSEAAISGTLSGLSSLFFNGKESRLVFNPNTGIASVGEANKAIRLVARKKDIPATNRGFGWRNLVTTIGAAYAFNGQRVLMGGEECRITALVGHIATVRKKDGTEDTISLNKLTDFNGRELYADPTDPEAFGELNRNAFWLLKDREWCRDFKAGDYVSLMETVTDTRGGRVPKGIFGSVIDRTTDGQLLVQMQGMTGARTALLSPRQVKPTRNLESLPQFFDRVRVDAEGVYGSQSRIGQDINIGVGTLRFPVAELTFSDGGSYTNNEADYFTAIYDPKATKNGERAILALSEDIPDKATKTLVPNKMLMDSIIKLFPRAKQIAVVREHQRTGMMGPDVVRPTTSQPSAAEQHRDNIQHSFVMRKAKSPFPFSHHYGPDALDTGHAAQHEKDATVAAGTLGAWFDEEAGEFTSTDPLAHYEKLPSTRPYRDRVPTTTQMFSPADEALRDAQSPIKIRIYADPKKMPPEVAARAVIHDISTIMREHSKFKELRDRTADIVPIDQVFWDRRIKLSADAHDLHLDVGDELSEFKSPAFANMSLAQIVKMTIPEKFDALARSGMSPGAAMDKAVMISSLFRYDGRHKRFSTSLNYYNEAQNFLKMFYGESNYNELVFENIDHAFCAKATEEKLKPVASKYIDDIKSTSEVDDSDLVPIVGFRTDLIRKDEGRGYQNATIRRLLANDHMILANDQGTGKTVCVLATIKERMNRGQVRRALVIGPAPVVKNSWPGEISKWCKESTKEMQVVEKNIQNLQNSLKELDPEDSKHASRIKQISNDIKAAEKRLEVMSSVIEPSVAFSAFSDRGKDKFWRDLARADAENKPFIATASFEMIQERALELAKAGFDAVVIDEAQRIKNEKAKTTIMLNTAFGPGSSVKYRIAATGTPIENSAADLHSIATWVKPEIFGSLENFQDNFVDVEYMKTPEGRKPIAVGIKQYGELIAKLRPIFHRVSKDDLAEMEQKEIKEKLGEKNIEYNSLVHYGAVSPRNVYPKPVFDTTTGQLSFAMPKVSAESGDYDLYKPVTFDELGENKNKYLQAYGKVMSILAHKYYGMKMLRTKYGKNINMQVAGLTMAAQQALNDMDILINNPKMPELHHLRADPLFKNLPNPKVERLKKIIDEHAKKPYKNVRELSDLTRYAAITERGKKLAVDTRGKMIIFAREIETVKMLKRRLEDMGMGHRLAFFVGTTGQKRLSATADRSAEFKKFKTDDSVDILIANDAAQTGLNLPEANLIVNYDGLWNPQAINQRIDRAHRVGTQPRPVTAVNLVLDKTIEEKLVRAQAFKTLLSAAVLDPISRKKEGVSQAMSHLQAMRKAGDVTLAGDNESALDSLITDNPEWLGREEYEDIQQMIFERGKRPFERAEEKVRVSKEFKAVRGIRPAKKKRSVIGELGKKVGGSVLKFLRGSR